MQALVGVSPKGLAEPKAQMLQPSAQCNKTGADAECAEGADGWHADGADGRPQGQHLQLLYMRTDGNAGGDQAYSPDHPADEGHIFHRVRCLPGYKWP